MLDVPPEGVALLPWLVEGAGFVDEAPQRTPPSRARAVLGLLEHAGCRLEVLVLHVSLEQRHRRPGCQ